MSSSIALQLSINGEVRRFDGPLTVDGLLLRLGLDGRKIAVERNLEIVPKSLYASTHLVDRDRIEVVNFVGGG
jgi:thiamine biosynthesis protein ThiS